MKIRKSKPSIFIFAILAAFLVVFLGLVSCSSSTTSTTPDTGTTSSVTSVSIKNGLADAGDTITKVSTDPAFSLTAEVVVVGGAATTVTWSSSDRGVATVDASGLVTIIGGGTTTITATSTVDATKKDSVELVVTGPGVTSVSIKNGLADAGAVISNQFTASGTLTLTADVVTIGAVANTVTWTSSDTTVATVANDGTVTMLAVGSTIIKAVSTKNATREDSVELVLTTDSISPTVASVTLKYGGRDAADTLDKSTRDTTFTLSAVVAVQGGAATTVTWTSSDTGVATVDANGLVTIVAAGSTTITAESTVDATKQDSIALTVTAVAVTSVTVQGASTIGEVGESLPLTATVVVTGGASQDVTWTSATTSVATVDVNTGVVSLVGTGTAVITATSTHDNSKTDSITVTTRGVVSVALLNGNVDATGFIAKKVTDNPFTLTADVVVIGGAATTVTWSSSKTGVATVDANTGEVTLVGVGSTIITATSTRDSSKSDTVALGVIPAAATVTSVVAQGALTLGLVGESFMLTATVVVTGGAPTTVTWSSSDTSVATVDVNTGVVTIIGGGTSVITATSTHDNSQTDTVTVTGIQQQ